MKKILSIIMLLIVSASLYAQKDVTKFLGIPVDGTKRAMIQKLKAKGFVYNLKNDYLSGQFNGKKVHIYIATNSNKVYRIMVADATYIDETNIKIRFNTLCDQFSNNQNYIHTDKDFSIPEDEKISYECLVNKKRYDAIFYQKPSSEAETIDMYKKSVWFTIDQSYLDYGILMYYDNEYNKANGEDL